MTVHNANAKLGPPVYGAVAVGVAAALVAPDAQAGFFSGTGLNQDVQAGGSVTSIGGMSGVNIYNRSTFTPDTPRFYFAGANGSKTLDVAVISTSSLPFGTVIGESTDWTNNLTFLGREEPMAGVGMGNCGAAYGAGDGFFGVRFQRNAGSPSFAPVTNYGWIQVSAVDNGCFAPTATLLGWGWDDSGASVFAGQTAAVPEPSTLAMLAMGGLAGAALRHRRRAARSRIPT